jgi:general secretion pathway protein B
MSYILDALRKAEAERERGTVPGLHAQPAFAAGAAPGRARPTSRVAVLVAVVGVLLVAAAALPWFFMAGRSPSSPVAPVVATAAPAPALAPVPVAMPVPVPAPQPAPAPAPMAAPPTTTASASTTLQAAPAPVRKSRPVPSVATVASSPATVPSTAVPKADGRLYALSELPDDIRRQLPTLSVGGSMYSASPASRLVIINGQVLHEGDRITPELVLQQIRLKSAVLAFKGYRYTLAF